MNGLVFDDNFFVAIFSLCRSLRNKNLPWQLEFGNFLASEVQLDTCAWLDMRLVLRVALYFKQPVCCHCVLVCLFCLCQLSKFPKVVSYLLIPADAVHLSTETYHSLPSRPINLPINMQIGKFYLSTKTVSTAIHGLSPQFRKFEDLLNFNLVLKSPQNPT